MAKSTCSVQDCPRETKARGWCQRHYDRWWKHGDPTKTLTPMRIDGTVEYRFWSKVDKSETCWLWTAGRNLQGYGRFTELYGTRLAHRISWEMLVGPIPEWLELDHLCRTPACVRPSHLEPVTSRVNVLRGEGIPAKNAQKTHCKHNHKFTPENTYNPPGQPNSRMCRECARARSRSKTT